MSNFFGPATAKLVDDMGEDECIPLCRAKVQAFLGSDAALEFDRLIEVDDETH